MSISFNQVTIAGNLTRDGELKYIQGGKAVCDVGLAINETYKDANGNKQERCDFVDVTFFGRTAEVLCEYAGKGDPILVSGKLRLDTWESDGQKRSKLKVVADRLQLLGRRERGEADTQTQQEEPTF